MTRNSSLAVIILTFNEEANLEAALDSVKGWAKEVFVVDSYSTDRTVDIALAREHDSVCVVQHQFEDYSRQWNWALANLPITAEWTLKLDADERCTAEFKAEVDEAVASAPRDVEGMLFRRRIIFMGKGLRGGGSSNSYVMHLWRTGQAVFEDRTVNEHAVVAGAVHYLSNFVDHHNTKSLSDWLEKHNRYTSLEAASILAGNLLGGVQPRLFGRSDERRIWLRRAYYRFPSRVLVALVYFFYRFVWKGGFVDGAAGFQHCFLQVAFRYIIDLKIQEYRRCGIWPEVTWPTRGEPHPLVRASPLQQKMDRIRAAA